MSARGFVTTLTALDFRDRLLKTLGALQPILRESGVLVAGSEVPNLLEGNTQTLVVSEDVDIAIPVEHHAALKRATRTLTEFEPAAEEPSVWLPRDSELLEVNFIGLDRSLRSLDENYVFEDAELPLLVFGQLSLLQPAPPLDFAGVLVPLPRKAGLALEKLLTERSGRKGDRDLLVVAGLLQLSSFTDLDEFVDQFRRLSEEQRYNVTSNLTVLSLMSPATDMPDPTAVRDTVAELLKRLDSAVS